MNQDKDYKNTKRDIKRKVKSINKSIDKENDISFSKYKKHINNLYESLADKQFDLINSINTKLNKSFRSLSKSMTNNADNQFDSLISEFSKFEKIISNKAKSGSRALTNEFTNSVKSGFTTMSKSASSTFKSILSDSNKMTDNLHKHISSITEDLRDWSVALNVDKMTDKLDEATMSVRELRISMSKSGISKGKFRNLESYAEDQSAQSGYSVDKSDVLEAMNDMISQGYKDPEDLKVYGTLLQKFKYLGGEIETFTEIVDTFNQAGFGGADGVKQFTSELYALQNSDIGVNIEQLSETIKEFNGGKGGFRALANGNKALYDKYVEGAMSLTAANSSSYMGDIDKALLNLMKMDPESLADMASQNNAGWLMEVQKQMRSGDMKSAAVNFLQNYNKQRAQLLQSGGQDAWLTFSKEMDWGDLREDQISDQRHIDEFLKTMDESDDILQKEKSSVTKSIDTMDQEVGIFDRISNFLKSNRLTSKISDFFDDLGMSFTEILFVVNQGSQLLEKLGLGKVLSKVGNKLSKGGLSILGKFGISSFKRALPALGTAATVVSAASSVNQMATADTREEQFGGAAKLGITGAGAAIGGIAGAIFGGPGGALLGAKIGSGIGSIIAEAIGDSLGPALMHGWDSATEFLSEMTTSLEKVASDFWNGFTDIAKNILDTVVGLFDMAFESIFNVLGLDWSSFKDTVSQSISDFISSATDAWNTVYSVASSIWDSLTSYASSFWNSVYKIGSGIWSSLGSLASGVFDKIKSVFSNSPLGTLASGISKVIDAVGGVLSDANSRGKAIVDGSHKDGLDTVPKDGYIAELHKNEAVLTADQADTWRGMNNNPESFFHDAYQSALASYDKNAMIRSYQAQAAKSGSGNKIGSNGTLSTQDQLGIWRFFRDSGYSKEATAGIMGNLSAETGGTFSSSIIQGNGAGPAAGIAQWENYNTKSGRWENLANYAASQGKQWDDLQSQLQFIDREMQGEDPTTLQKLNDNYGGYEGYKQLNDVATATSAFLSSFERTGVTSDAERLSAANDAYDKFSQYKQGTPWVPNDQIALLHQGEMVVPSDNNPYNSSTTASSDDDASLSEVIDTLKWGITRLESAIKESNNSSYNLSNSTRDDRYSESDSVFRFANP